VCVCVFVCVCVCAFYLNNFSALNFPHNKLRKAALTNYISMLQYGRDVALSRDTCDSHRISLLKYEEVFKKYLIP